MQLHSVWPYWRPAPTLFFQEGRQMQRLVVSSWMLDFLFPSYQALFLCPKVLSSPWRRWPFSSNSASAREVNAPFFAAAWEVSGGSPVVRTCTAWVLCLWIFWLADYMEKSYVHRKCLPMPYSRPAKRLWLLPEGNIRAGALDTFHFSRGFQGIDWRSGCRYKQWQRHFCAFALWRRFLQLASLNDGRGISGRQQCCLFFQIH